MEGKAQKITLKHLQQLKGKRPFSCLTAYDATFARVCSEAGIEVILVGDSLGNVIQGEKTTVPVTMEHMIYHTRCVAKAEPRSLLMVDMPFASFCTLEQGLQNASDLMRAGAELIKFEYNDTVPGLVRALKQIGIPSCVHLGLLPQSYFIDGYSVQGKNEADAQTLRQHAQLACQAGAACLLIECVPGALAGTVAQAMPIPVIGIGAGPDVDGQILVCYDVLGLTPGAIPRFVKNFMAEHASIADAITAYVNAVEAKHFPLSQHSYT